MPWPHECPTPAGETTHQYTGTGTECPAAGVAAAARVLSVAARQTVDLCRAARPGRGSRGQWRGCRDPAGAERAAVDLAWLMALQVRRAGRRSTVRPGLALVVSHGLRREPPRSNDGSRPRQSRFPGGVAALHRR